MARATKLGLLGLPTSDLSVADVSITPGAISTVARSLASVVILGSISITPTPANALCQQQIPSVSITGTPVASLRQATRLGLLALPISAMVSQDDLFITPDSINSIARTTNGAVSKSSLNITAASSVSISRVIEPSVNLGSLNIVPSALNSRASTVDPNILGSGISVSPGSITAIPSVVNPTVNIGSITISPASVSMVSSVIDPVYNLGNLTITPISINSYSHTIDPAIQKSSASIIPGPIVSYASGIDPTFIIDSTEPFRLGNIDNVWRVTGPSFVKWTIGSIPVSDIQLLEKTSTENRLFDFDLSGHASISQRGAVITSVTSVALVSGAGLTLGLPTHTDSIVQVRISGGTNKTRYRLKCIAMTDQGDSVEGFGDLFIDDNT